MHVCIYYVYMYTMGVEWCSKQTRRDRFLALCWTPATTLDERTKSNLFALFGFLIEYCLFA